MTTHNWPGPDDDEFWDQDSDEPIIYNWPEPDDEFWDQRMNEPVLMEPITPGMPAHKDERYEMHANQLGLGERFSVSTLTPPPMPAPPPSKPKGIPPFIQTLIAFVLVGTLLLGWMTFQLQSRPEPHHRQTTQQVAGGG